MLLLYISVFVVSSFVVWKGGGMLEQSAEKLAVHYKLPPLIQGSILTAVGSSFPELSTTVISTLIHGKFDLGVSTIVGSAIFNILMIPALTVIISGTLKSELNLIFKDIQYYIISIGALFITFAIAVIYSPVDDTSFQGNVSRVMALLPVAFYIFYLYLQRQETKAYKEDKPSEDIDSSIWKIWLRFLMSLLLILISVEGLVRTVIFMGDYFSIPDFFWGAIVLAAVTSTPDAIVSVKEAFNKKGIVSLANVIGSNIFDLLIAVPAGILIAGSSTVNMAVAGPMMLFLTISTFTLIILLINGNNLTSRNGWILLSLYVLFIVWIILETIGVLNLMF